ncbi:hypothetical protein [Spirillospora sp. NPDC047279]|uniref:hypothetical protein n=1 Tax=Spirillospora sp. NPDC047279 TaxID=3155478 RepID=UPI0033EB51C5
MITFCAPALRCAAASSRFVTHHFGFDDFPQAYEVFANAADTGALKVVISR